MYDLIGDIHGHAGPLERLLTKLGYEADGEGVWRHPSRQVIFLGDFIDRGPAQMEVISIVRPMVDNGAALAVMGNHEFNAIMYATKNPDRSGEYLRVHSSDNWKQHKAFVKAVGGSRDSDVTEKQQELIDWFKTLPVYLDLEGLRVVHACWHRPSFDALTVYLDDGQRFRENAWTELGTKGTAAYEAAEVLLKGWEIPLPLGITFRDKDDKERDQIRTRWWERAQRGYRQLAIVPDDAIDRIPDSPIAADSLPGYDGDKLLFLGHYWLTGDPEPLTDHIACLDYSIAGENAADTTPGKLCAYRFDGEARLIKDKFVWVPG